MNSYVFVINNGVDESAEPLRGKTIEEAVADAVRMWDSMSMYDQCAAQSAWVVNKAEYEAEYEGDHWWRDCVDFLHRPLKWGAEVGEVYTESTGGGFWIAYIYVDEHKYYVLDNDLEWLCEYDDTDEGVEGMCMSPIKECDMENLSGGEKVIHKVLHKALEEQGVL